MKRLRSASKTDDINTLIANQVKTELDKLTKYFDVEDGESYVTGFNGKVAINCAQQYGGFELYLNFDGDKVEITNSNGDNIEEMAKIYEDSMK